MIKCKIVIITTDKKSIIIIVFYVKGVIEPDRY